MFLVPFPVVEVLYLLSMQDAAPEQVFLPIKKVFRVIETKVQVLASTVAS